MATKITPEMMNDPPHERDIKEPCFACDAPWVKVDGTTGKYTMKHDDDCGFINYEED